MLRVAYLFERFPSFGQTFCYREAAELLRQGAEIHLFSIRRPGDEPPQDWDEKIVRAVTYLPDEAELVQEIDDARKSGALPTEAARELQAWGRQTDFLRLYQAVFVGLRLRGIGVHRVHAHFAGMAARTAYWMHRFFGIGYSFTAHGNDIFAPREFTISLEKLIDGAEAIVTVSDFAVADLKKRFPQSAGKIHRVYNGIELDCFPRADFRGSTPLILSIGRLIEKKGFGDLITACEELRRRGRDFRCEIIGEGPMEETLRAQIETAQLGDRVKLLGPLAQEEIIHRLLAATVFALACTMDAEGGMDNLPTVIMEAMAAGLPIVSTPVAGVPEMVQPEINGKLVPPGDATALATALGEIISQPAVARELGERSRARAAEKFTLEANVRSLAKVLRAC